MFNIITWILKIKLTTYVSLIKHLTNKAVLNLWICKRFTGGTLLVAQLVEALRYKPEGRGFAPL